LKQSLICVVLLAAVSVVAAPAGRAQARDVIGHGGFSCGQWTEHQRDQFFALIDGAWLAGYLSAYSMYGDQVDLPDQPARNSWVSNYCRNHPLDPIYTAADHLIIELVTRQSSQLH
jgi:hypothetical protein